jgi:hypothetical protein
MQVHTRVGLVAALLASIFLVFYLVLLGTSRVYVSGSIALSLFDPRENPIWNNPLLKKAQSLNLPGLEEPGPIVVNKVEANHAIRNGAFIFCTAASIALLPIFLIILGFILIVIGIFSGDWNAAGLGLLVAIVMVPLSVLVVALFILGSWLALLFQPCTPAYALLWIFLGIPLIPLGAAFGAAPPTTIIIIINPGN